MREPHKVSGQLAGDYVIPLASCAGKDVTSKRLDLVLSVSERNLCSAWFRVLVNDKAIAQTQCLAEAIWLYDEAEAGK